MRLINCETLEVVEFVNPPKYAILSHTWDEDEITFQEMMRPDDTTRRKAGFHKILKVAELAKELRYEWMWVDTACIDRSSSAELSEAINSMYAWYQEAEMCLVYLADFTAYQNDDKPEKRPDIVLHIDQGDLMKHCRWLTRGWTLQELIAPQRIIFYGSRHRWIGDKTLLLSSLSRLTSISRTVLKTCNPFQATVAERMCWAAGRSTTRPEDTAYCLMGLFDINMPLLYGERQNAFTRLQEAILKTSDDHTLFAWQPERNQPSLLRGLLAHSPLDFQMWRHKSLPYGRLPNKYDDSPSVMTNKGLQVTLPIAPWSSLFPMEAKHNLLLSQAFSARLNCHEDILLCLIEVPGKDQYARVDQVKFAKGTPLDSTLFITRTIYIRQSIQVDKAFFTNRVQAWVISCELPSRSPEIAIISQGDNVSINRKAMTEGYRRSILLGTMLDDAKISTKMRIRIANLKRAGLSVPDPVGCFVVGLTFGREDGSYRSGISYVLYGVEERWQNWVPVTIDAQSCESSLSADGVTRNGMDLKSKHDHSQRLKLTVDMYTKMIEDSPVIAVEVLVKAFRASPARRDGEGPFELE